MPTVPATSLTAAAISHRIGNPGESETERIFDLAVGEVEAAFAGAWRHVPVAVVDECVYRVARAIKDSANKNAGGGGQVTATEGAPLRTPADPLVSSYPLIRRYVALGL